MRRSTALMAQWQADSQTGNAIHFERCKGGYFSDREEYGLRVVGKTAQNGTPSPQNSVSIQCVKQGTKVKVCRKNLFDVGTPRTQSKAGVTYTVHSDKRVTATGTATGYSDFFLGYVNVVEGETYTITEIPNSNLVYPIQYFSSTDGAGSMVGTGTTYSSFTTPSGCKSAGIFLKRVSNAPVNLDAYIMVEPGTTATAYEPYQGNEITVPCDLYEGDVWYPAIGKVVKKNGIVSFDGTEEVRLVDGASALIVSPKMINPKRRGTNTELYGTCSHARKYDNAFDNATISTAFLTAYSPLAKNTEVEIRNIVASYGIEYTVEAIREWIRTQYTTGAPLTVVYELVDPVVEQYDPQPIQAYPGTVNVLQQPTDLPADLSATLLCRR